MTNIVLLTKEKESLKIQIQNQCSLPVKLILFSFLVPMILLPIIGIILAANLGKLNFGIIFGALVFSVLLVYPLLKITVWQIYGQEIFLLHKDKVTYEACFKFLKHQFDEMTISQLEILFSDRELKKDERIGTLVFLSKENKLKSALKINQMDYQKIIETIRTLHLNSGIFEIA